MAFVATDGKYTLAVATEEPMGMLWLIATGGEPGAAFVAWRQQLDMMIDKFGEQIAIAGFNGASSGWARATVNPPHIAALVKAIGTDVIVIEGPLEGFAERMAQMLVEQTEQFLADQ